MAAWKPDIYTYLDFRAFLRAYYDAGKAHQRGFSYRWFARRAGFASSNFLKLVIDGDRNLGRESAIRVADAIGLTADEQRFFCQLVEFGQADDPDVKAACLERLSATRRFLDARPIDGLLLEYLSRWYHVAIRELAGWDAFVDDPVWIAQQLRPQIAPAEAAAALDVLLRLGLLERDEHGRIRRGEPTLDAGHEVTAVGARTWHLEMLRLAGESIDRTPREQRDLGAMTVCVPRAALPEIKARLQQFREQLMAWCDDQTDSDCVVQVNLQLFPLSDSATTP